MEGNSRGVAITRLELCMAIFNPKLLNSARASSQFFITKQIYNSMIFKEILLILLSRLPILKPIIEQQFERAASRCGAYPPRQRLISGDNNDARRCVCRPDWSGRSGWCLSPGQGSQLHLAFQPLGGLMDCGSKPSCNAFLTPQS